MSLSDTDVLSVPAFDIEQTVLAQYANSPTLSALISYISQWFDPAADIESFYEDVWDIDQAIDFGLDIWGRILGVSRVLQIQGTSGLFGFDTADSPPDWENFGNVSVPGAGGPFFAGQELQIAYKLQNDAYRQLLLTKAMANIIATVAPALNALLTNLFAGRGRCYVTDNGGMKMSFVFEFALSAIDRAILSASGVLPHPAGVGVNTVIVTPGLFVFREGGMFATPLGYGVLNGGN